MKTILIAGFGLLFLCSTNTMQAGLGFEVINLDSKNLTLSLQGNLSGDSISNPDFLFIESPTDADWIRLNVPRAIKTVDMAWSGEPFDINLQRVVASDRSGIRGKAMIELYFESPLTEFDLATGELVTLELPNGWEFLTSNVAELAITWGHSDSFTKPYMGEVQAISSVPEPSTYALIACTLILGTTVLLRRKHP